VTKLRCSPFILKRAQNVQDDFVGWKQQGAAYAARPNLQFYKDGRKTTLCMGLDFQFRFLWKEKGKCLDVTSNFIWVNGCYSAKFRQTFTPLFFRVEQADCWADYLFEVRGVCLRLRNKRRKRFSDKKTNKKNKTNKQKKTKKQKTRTFG